MNNDSKKAGSYKVCILTAGIGSRVGHATQFINKGVLPVNNKAVISYIVEKFPLDTEIVIALGHKKDTVVDYLALAHPDRAFTFVEVDKYTGVGSGPGYSLLACKEHLQTPFVFCTSDTIVLEDIPPLHENWIGIAPVLDTENYCTVNIKNNLVVQLDNKIKSKNKFAFIGLAGILDYAEFFSALEQNQELCNNELQMVDGFYGLLDRKLVPTGFTWFDTGTKANYEDTNTHFSGGGAKFDFSKEDEFLYFVNDLVIKFFADPVIAERRYKRAHSSLKGLTPPLEDYRGNFYSYKLVPGQTLYNALNPQVMADFLSWAEADLWKPIEIPPNEQEMFHRACTDFYRAKTEKRLDAFYQKLGITNEPEYINEVKTPPVRDLLKKIDWSQITDGIPSKFHGDLQFDNVLLLKNSNEKFLLLDWRQDFGGLIDMGDLYYDLAKLYGGLVVSYPLIKENMFTCDISDNHLHYNFYTTSALTEAREQYERFLLKKGFSLDKIKIMVSLIFLNMSPLHNAPFDCMLYGLGRTMLAKALDSSSS